MITVELEGAEQVQKQLLRLQQRAGSMPIVMASIGEHMLNSTADNFENSTAPDGTPWEQNSGATLANYLGKTTGKKRDRKAGNKLPLIASHALSQDIHYYTTATSVTVGTNKKYAAMMHFGGRKSDYPHLWGDIPARPFLGITQTDEQVVLEMVKGYLANGV